MCRNQREDLDAGGDRRVRRVARQVLAQPRADGRAQQLGVVVAGQQRHRPAESQEAAERIEHRLVGGDDRVQAAQRLGVGRVDPPRRRRRLEEVQEVAEQHDAHERRVGVEAPQQPHDRLVVGEPVDQPRRPRRQVEVGQEEEVAAVIDSGPWRSPPAAVTCRS